MQKAVTYNKSNLRFINHEAFVAEVESYIYFYNYPNPGIEIMMLAQVLNAPKKSPKSFITNKVHSVFVNSLSTSTPCTVLRDSISGFGNYKRLNYAIDYLTPNLKFSELLKCG